MTAKALPVSALCQECDERQLDFDTTADLKDLTEVIGQARAVESAQFGIGIRREGYNLFALGPTGTGKFSLINRLAKEKAATEPLPNDWCYVNNFKEAHKPRALELAPGLGDSLRRDMDQLVDDLRSSMPAAYESEEYRTQVQAIQEEVKEREESALQELQKSAKEKGIALIRTPAGFAFAPTKDDEVVSPDEYDKLSKTERKRIERDVEELQQQLQRSLHQVPQWKKEIKDRVKSLDREVATYSVSHLIESLQEKYRESAAVTEYLGEVREDVIDHLEDFRSNEEEGPTVLGIQLSKAAEGPSFNRYKVNVLVGHANGDGAPVIYEDNPSYQNLVGRVEHLAQLGALVTDFTMIKSGALHRANGGYLLIDAQKVLMQPYAWEGLKRALRSRQIHIESLGQMLSLVSTVSLEPAPVPMNVKVVMLGDPYLYYLLAYYDPEFGELFKVAVDFDDRMQRDADSSRLYPRLIATLVRKEDLRHFHRTAVARVIEHSARAVGDAERLSTHMGSVQDLLREADYWADEAGADIVRREHVQHAIDSQIHRSDRLQQRIQEEIQRGTILIDTEGERVGAVNGLSVMSLGQYSFGQPSRITARVRLGEGEVIDIEREVELGGPIHSKGVMILAGYLGARFAHDRPLSLSASLVFEQSYGEIEGDSASSTELYALLSALAEAPIKQCFAVTGSVNQQGEVQPIGGVNEKIEGFFDVCRARELTGEQGVLIPESNVKHLMLRQDVVDAVADGKFSIYAVATIDEGIEILTGVPAGERDASGRFPPNSINYRVDEKIRTLSEKMHAFATATKGAEAEDEKGEAGDDEGAEE